MLSPGSPPTLDSDELAQFREAWKAELRRSTGTQSVKAIPKLSANSAPTDDAEIVKKLETSQAINGPFYVKESRSGISSTSSNSPSSAVNTYRLAVQYEQQGQLEDALQFYRHAFKMDPNVDKAYHKEELSLAAVSSFENSGGHHDWKTASVASSVDEAVAGIRALSLHPPLAQAGSITRSLINIVSTFPHDLSFKAEDTQEGIPIRILPDEVLVLILRKLDPFTIETFAAVNRKARVLTLDSTIWRELVQMTYIPPQIPNDKAMDVIVERYMADYRRVYVEHPRLRLDGVYIAVCHYIRSGLSENAWINVSHLITYHRYLRFLSNGQVLSLLANEEVEPQIIVRQLKPTLRMKGLFIGNWALHDTTVIVTNLTDPSGSTTRYTFRMTLDLRSRPLGRWNKLEFVDYDSIDCETGEATPLALKNERPFWFSKVRSYS